MRVSRDNVGQLVKELREGRNLTQGELAKRVGILQPQISKIEAGHKHPSVPTLVRIVEALEYTLEIREVKRTPH